MKVTPAFRLTVATVAFFAFSFIIIFVFIPPYKIELYLFHRKIKATIDLVKIREWMNEHPSMNGAEVASTQWPEAITSLKPVEVIREKDGYLIILYSGVFCKKKGVIVAKSSTFVNTGLSISLDASSCVFVGE